MSVPVWQAGKQYQPGDLVRASNGSEVVQANLDNPNFEEGDTGWFTYGGWRIESGRGYTGDWDAIIGDGGIGEHLLTNKKNVTTAPGSQVICNAFVMCTGGQGGVGPADGTHILLRVHWLDENLTELGHDDGVYATEHTAFNHWVAISVSVIAPQGAVNWTLSVVVDGNADVQVDDITTIYSYQPPDSGLIFRAVQAATGFSGSAEPSWPSTLGQTVVDNEVTWQAIAGNSITWQAHRILVSGASEPTFPTSGAGAVVADNTINWNLDPRRVEDPKKPGSTIVAIAASKVFAGANDIVAYSATVNPLDWSTHFDAGYLPFGLQTYGANPITAMGLYRGNLVVFNSVGAQIWQVDENPTGMALLDAVPLGCTYQKSAQPVANDFVFLSQEGIRSVGIAGSQINLQAGYFGKQVDEPVLKALKNKDADDEPRGLYWPEQGQYWLLIGAEAFVLTMNGGEGSRSWSRYVFPEKIDDWTILGDDLYLRAGDLIWRLTDEVDVDDAGGADHPIVGEMQWPYLDMGTLGVTKMLHGIDLVMDAPVSMSIGYDQTGGAYNATGAWTPLYDVPSDTLTGQIIPIPVAAPSFSVYLKFDSGQRWEFIAANLYLQGLRPEA